MLMQCLKKEISVRAKVFFETGSGWKIQLACGHIPFNSWSDRSKGKAAIAGESFKRRKEVDAARAVTARQWNNETLGINERKE